MDYSSKYGLGYQLSDQTVGVYFNDNTKMIAEKEGDKEINYVYSTKTKDKNQPQQTIITENMQKISLTEFPPELKKKITLYKHFFKYFKNKKLKVSNNFGPLCENDDFLHDDVQILVQETDKSTSPPDHCQSAFKASSNLTRAANVYIQRYYRTKYTIVFLLSNKSFQISYADQSELIFVLDSKVVHSICRMS